MKDGKWLVEMKAFNGWIVGYKYIKHISLHYKEPQVHCQLILYKWGTTEIF